jgi:hypothetical protein
MTLSGEQGPTVITEVQELKELAGDHGSFIADLYTNNGGELASNLKYPGFFEKIVGEAVGTEVHLAS